MENTTIVLTKNIEGSTNIILFIFPLHLDQEFKIHKHFISKNEVFVKKNQNCKYFVNLIQIINSIKTCVKTSYIYSHIHNKHFSLNFF